MGSVLEQVSILGSVEQLELRAAQTRRQLSRLGSLCDIACPMDHGMR